MFQRFSWLAASGLARQAALLLVSLTLVQRLSGEVFGAFAFCSSTVLLLTGVSEFGLRQVAWARLARRPGHGSVIVGRLLLARCVTGCLALALYAGFAAWSCQSTLEACLFALMAPNLIVNAVAFDFPSLASGEVSKLGRRVMAAFAVYGAVVWLTVHSDRAVLMVPVYLLLANGWLCGSLYRDFRAENGPPRARVSWRAVTRTLKEATPLGLNFFITRLAANYPVILVGLLATRETVADYRLAEMFYLFIASFGVHLAGAAFSGLARKVKGDKQSAARTVEQLVGATASLASVAAIGFATLGVPTLEWWTKRSSPEFRHVAWVLAAAIVAGTVSRLLKSLLPSLGIRAPLVKAGAFGATLGLALGACLVGPFGAIGAAAAVLISEASVAVALLATLHQNGCKMDLMAITSITALGSTSSLVAFGVGMIAGIPYWLSGIIASGAGLAAVFLTYSPTRNIVHLKTKTPA